MMKRIKCVFLLLALCAAAAVFGGCGRDLGDWTEPAPEPETTEETVILTLTREQYEMLFGAQP